MKKRTLTCSIPECGDPVHAGGYCNKHYKRLKRNGGPSDGRTPDGEPRQFYEKTVLLYTGDDCLIWPYNRTKGGYGRMTVDDKLVYVNRRVCEDVNGPPPTPKHEAAHSCGNGHLGCVTKSHPSWKTRKENQADKLVHDTHNRGERNPRAKINEEQAREILSLKGKKLQREISAICGVSEGIVGKIHRGERWAWLQDCAS